ncbi:MAG: hypothetical protein IPI50_06325 [Saprospiraceae bacterium]|nr:hypothetical protein [Saprospiraceae bacterium]
MLFGEEQVQSVETISAFLWKDEVVAQTKALSIIESVISGSKFPHCSLISGRSGSAPLMVALTIAQNLFCKNGPVACGACSACYKVGELIHPDLHFSFPLFGAGEISTDHYGNFKKAVKDNPWMNVQNWLAVSDKENKQANITAKEARSIIDRMYLKPFESDKNVLILWLPEFLGKESNILLKLLEEPPGHAYIILVTEDINALLPTVLSRAQRFNLLPIHEDDLTIALVKKTNIPQAEAFGIAISVEGNLSSALELSAAGKSESLQYLQWMFQAAFKKDPIEFWNWTEKIAALNRDQQRSFFYFVQLILSLSIRLNHQTISSDGSNHPIIQYAQKLTSSLNLSKIQKINELVNDCAYAVQRNANIRILLHDFLIQLSGIIKDK